jgi:excisionase family DNA binding protein
MLATANTRLLLTVKEAATYLRLHPQSVRRMIRDGRLPASRLGPPGTSVRVDERDLHDFVYSDPEEASSEWPSRRPANAVPHPAVTTT